MPEENPVIITDKILFCIMICFSYPLIVYACNQVIESFIFGRMEYSTTRKWLKNLSRTINLALALLIAITFYYKLHKILGFSAVVFGSIIVLVFPALIHNKISAETGFQRFGNYFVLCYSIIASITIAIFIILTWDKKDHGH